MSFGVTLGKNRPDKYASFDPWDPEFFGNLSETSPFFFLRSMTLLFYVKREESIVTSQLVSGLEGRLSQEACLMSCFSRVSRRSLSSTKMLSSVGALVWGLHDEVTQSGEGCPVCPWQWVR